MSKKTIAYLELIAAGVSWGFIGLFTRNLSAAGIGADNIALLRCVGSALFSAAFFALTDRSAFHITLRDVPLHFGNGVLSTLGSAYFYMYCQTQCSLAVSGILLYTAPAIVVVLYADTITPSMRRAIDETERRRSIQDAYNKAHGIVPKTIKKDIREVLEISKREEASARRRGQKTLSDREREEEIRKLEKQMLEASRMLEFEYAAILRDRIIELRKDTKK